MKARILFEKGETHRNPEDFQYVNLDKDRMILKAAAGDWASNLVGKPYEDPELSDALGKPIDTKYNGGFIGANVAKHVIASTNETGYKLIEKINKALARKYEELIATGRDDLLEYRRRRELTFTGYIAHLMATPEEMVITGVGDVKLAADRRILTGKTKEVDIYHPLVRRLCIERYGDAEGGFAHIRPLIVAQFQRQNVPGHPLSYPAIDGTETLPVEDVSRIVIQKGSFPGQILIWTDAYVDPDEFTIEGLERKLAHVYEVDPLRYLEYPSVGIPLDDRTIIELTELDDWAALETEFVKPSFYRK